jgi:hypothetical protein
MSRYNIEKVRSNVVQRQEFLQTLFEGTNRRRRSDEKSLDELFQQPILHRQINRDEIYVPLDVVRLGWKAEP